MKKQNKLRQIKSRLWQLLQETFLQSYLKNYVQVHLGQKNNNNNNNKKKNTKESHTKCLFNLVVTLYFDSPL